MAQVSAAATGGWEGIVGAARVNGQGYIETAYASIGGLVGGAEYGTARGGEYVRQWGQDAHAGVLFQIMEHGDTGYALTWPYLDDEDNALWIARWHLNRGEMKGSVAFTRLDAEWSQALAALRVTGERMAAEREERRRAYDAEAHVAHWRATHPA